MKRNFSTLVALSLLITLPACNLPGTAQPISMDDLAATAIAATLTAQPTANTTSTATAPSTPAVTSPSTSAATPTITPTYSTPMLTVLEQTNCREGPGQDYQVIFTYLAKKKLEIVGRYDPANFWLVRSPDSKTGTCWLWGQYVEVTGSYWLVPTLTPPPTATVAPPQAPSIQKWDFSCSGGTMTFSIQWEDRATNETGYRIFRDGELVAELPANSTSFTESVALLASESATYYLQVYGPSGSANSAIMKPGC
jgi:SH3-like domain-containing protein